MALTDTACRKAQPKDKPYKLADAGGLHLYVTTTGFKSWRLKYRFDGKERRLTFGAYPDVTLAEARERRDEARKQLRDHKDPGVERELAKAAALADTAATFESVARRWHAAQAERWSAHYAYQIMNALERDVLPEIGRFPIKSVTSKMVLDALRKIEDRGARETAHRLRGYISSVFVFAIPEGLVATDVAPPSLVKGLKKVPKAKKYQAITDLTQLRRFMHTIDTAGDIGPVTKFASRLLALTAVRPGVIIGTPWDEIENVDWTGRFIGPPRARPVWRIPPARLKLDVEEKSEGDYELVLPLAWQAVEALVQLRRRSGRTPLLFPSVHGWRRSISRDTIRMAYRRQGFGHQHVPHGWRAAFSTIMNDRAKAALKAGDLTRKDDRQYIDLMLAHVPEGISSSELRYNRAEHQDDFARIAQEWADVLLHDAAPPQLLLAGREN